MANFFNRFRGNRDIPEPDIPPGETQGSDGDVADVEIEEDNPVDAPDLTPTDALEGLASRDAVTMQLRAQSAGCTATIREELGQVNLRLGPRLDFGVAASTRGGTSFLVIGASEADPDGHRWFQVAAGSAAQGWIRGDLIRLSSNCTELSFITEEDIVRPAPPPPPPDDNGDDRFPRPTPHRVTQGFREFGHQGFDLGSPEGTQLIAPQAGICIRRVICQNCTGDNVTIDPPCSDAVQSDPRWGFGYGNFITVRFDYAVVPSGLRAEMASLGLTNGFAYVLYAHLSRVDVSLGEPFAAGDSFGATGNVGCSTGPHLHFEVKVGRDETVSGRWLRQTAVSPELMFQY